MAAVYRAHDLVLGRDVAVKLFPSSVAQPEDVQRVSAEMSLLARTNHPSLVTLHDGSLSTDESSGPAFLVMELVEGEDLSRILTRGPLRSTVAASIGAAIAEGLAHIHELGIVHRDVKPANILVPTGSDPRLPPRAKLADLGIARIVDGARMTATGSVLGTAAYLSPEQVRGEPVGPASDIYGLGLVLLECVTGQRPFPGGPAEAATARLIAPPSIPVSLGAELSGLLAGMTAVDPQQRPAAVHVAAVLRNWATGMLVAVAAVSGQDDATERDPEVATRVLPVGITDRSTSGPEADGASATAVLPVPTETGPSHPGGVGAPPADASAPASSVDPALRRRTAVIGAVAAGIAALALALAAAAGPGAAAPPVPPAPSYAPVPGVLGEHLQQLQRSVEP